MTIKFSVTLNHVPPDVVVDVELWTSGLSGRKELDHEGSLVDGPGRRREDYAFSRVTRTLQCKGEGFTDYVYRGQAFMLRERPKEK